ncbi:AcrR family transcriptional regulator [Bradyrhizobium sp. cir1]|uniref:TetR/AcrR family transcriptional regulator n=1 Tax=Bradyrhizobium sp. cir1 TaxID=1445730 RepID=UPI0017D8F1F5|nr:TetR/AcrR family transcriptional regulator [Bradyrhizobium sp. cir1]MBB4371586.1 AcrR family transcriptional regulator [Bradyrhizobium sp. cir1]
MQVIMVKARRKTAVPSRPRGRRSKDMPDGREALLAAAIHAFACHGFDGADLRSVAAAANVSANLVRVHFGNKAALWEACLDRVVALGLPAMAGVQEIACDSERPLGERLCGVISAIAAFYAAHPDVRDFVLRHATEVPERAVLVSDQLLRPAYATVRQLFSAGIEAGIIRSRHPALFFALLNAALNQPPAFPMLLNRIAPEIDPETSRDLLVETTIATFLHLPS